jgi:hypothetical protein
MRTIMFVGVLVLVGILVAGFYQGWFHFSTASTDHTSSATISVDQDKIRADQGKAKEKVKELGRKAKKPGDPADEGEQHERQP